MKIKEFTIIKTHRGRVNHVTGPLEYLINYFGYTLQCGNSYNDKINRNPKTAKGLVSNLNKSVKETMGSCYDPDDYELEVKGDIK